jgi:urease accessory protein
MEMTMTTLQAVKYGLALAGLGLSGTASAHTGVDAGHGLLSGLVHPLTGVDHLLAMVAVGLWAGLVGGRARFAFPAAFLGMMLVAGFWGMSGAPLAGVEVGIAVSVLVLGLAIALRANPPLLAGAAACAIFAIFHGHAHGAELPEATAGATYALGFVLATATLHVIGLQLAQILTTRSLLAARLAGGGVALAGLALLAVR